MSQQTTNSICQRVNTDFFIAFVHNFQDKGQLKCSCTNSTVLFVRPDLNERSSSELKSLRTDYSLTAEPELVAAFYFDVIIRSVLALK